MKTIFRFLALFMAFMTLQTVSGQSSNHHCNGITKNRRMISDTLAPENTIVYLNPIRRFMQPSGTAFLIHPRVMLTAGHNVALRRGRGINRISALDIRYTVKGNRQELKSHFNVSQGNQITSGLDYFIRYDIYDDWGINPSRRFYLSKCKKLFQNRSL